MTTLIAALVAYYLGGTWAAGGVLFYGFLQNLGRLPGEKIS